MGRVLIDDGQLQDAGADWLVFLEEDTQHDMMFQGDDGIQQQVYLMPGSEEVQ